MQFIEQHIQAVIFSSPQPVMIQELKTTLEKTLGIQITEEEIEIQIGQIISRFATDSFAFELIKTGGGYQFLSKNTYFKTINNYINIQQRKKLSKSSLETLSIIAYHQQGITKGEIEQIRGVASDYSVDKLLEKELIEISGKKEAPGNPILYRVTQNFLDYFGLNNLNELPKLTDVNPVVENEIGVQEEDTIQPESV